MFKRLLIALFIFFLSNVAIGEELRNQVHYKLYKEGKYQELGNEVNNIKVKDNDDIYYMGLAYYHLGRKVEAGKVWKEYVLVEKTKNKDKWIATFPPKNDDSWKDKITNDQRTDFRKSNYLIFENKYKDALNAYEATIDKKISQSLSNQVELEAVKQKFVNKLERDRKITMGGILLIIAILIGVILAIIVVLIIRTKREKVRLAQQENDELNRNIELRSKELDLSDREIFNEKIKDSFVQRNPTLFPKDSKEVKITPIKHNYNTYNDDITIVCHKPIKWPYSTNISTNNIIISDHEPIKIEPSRRYEKADDSYNYKTKESEEEKVNRYLEEERKETTKLSEEKSSIAESKSIFSSNNDFSDSSYSSSSSSDSSSSSSDFSDSSYSND